MDTSILNTIKKLLGPSQDLTDFDTDIIVHINNAFSTLSDLGVGPPEGFYITDASSTWSDYINSANIIKDSNGKNILDNVNDSIQDSLPQPYYNNKQIILNKVKTYVYLKTKLHFDPPTNSALLESMKESIKELEWRLNVNAETKPDSEG